MVEVFSNARMGLCSLYTHLFKRGCPEKKQRVRCNRLAKLQLPSCPTATISPSCGDASLAQGSGAVNPLPPPPPRRQQGPARPALLLLLLGRRELGREEEGILSMQRRKRGMDVLMKACVTCAVTWVTCVATI